MEKEVFYEKMGKLENDVNSLKDGYCDLEKRTTDLEKNYHELDKNNSIRFTVIENEIKATKVISIDIKHHLMKKETEEKEKNKFSITTIIALLSIIIAIIAIYKK